MTSKIELSKSASFSKFKIFSLYLFYHPHYSTLLKSQYLLNWSQAFCHFVNVYLINTGQKQHMLLFVQNSLLQKYIVHQLIEKQVTATWSIISIVPDSLFWLYKLMNFFKVFFQRFEIKILEQGLSASSQAANGHVITFFACTKHWGIDKLQI